MRMAYAFLKVLIDACHSKTRSSTFAVREQIAHPDTYMKDVARVILANCVLIQEACYTSLMQ
jgi:hypothetical protein